MFTIYQWSGLNINIENVENIEGNGNFRLIMSMLFTENKLLEEIKTFLEFTFWKKVKWTSIFPYINFVLNAS